MTATKTTRRHPTKTPETQTIYHAGGPDPDVCHLLTDAGEPLCGTKARRGGLHRNNHLVARDKAKDTPCPACGRKRCAECAEIATQP